MREDGVRTVVWVTPWVNLDSVDGQRPPDARVRAAAPRAGAELRRGRRRPATSSATRDGEPYVGRWWMGTGSIVDFTSEAARELVARARAARCSSSGSRASRPTTARATTSRPTHGSPTAAPAPRRPGSTARLYRATTQEALDDVHPGRGVVFGRSGWTGQQAVGMLWGGDQASDFWSLRALLASLLTCGGERLLQPLPRRRRLPRPPPGRALRAGAAGPLGAARRADAADAGARPLPAGGLDLRRATCSTSTARRCCCTSGSSPTSGRPPRPRPARGLPIDAARSAWSIPDDPEGWRAGGLLLPRPVALGGAGARGGSPRAAAPTCPAATGSTGGPASALTGGRWIEAEAPLERIPLWVRAGSLLVTYPDRPRSRAGSARRTPARPLEATLWGEPPLGRAQAELAGRHPRPLAPRRVVGDARGAPVSFTALRGALLSRAGRPARSRCVAAARGVLRRLAAGALGLRGLGLGASGPPQRPRPRRAPRPSPPGAPRGRGSSCAVDGALQARPGPRLLLPRPEGDEAVEEQLAPGREVDREHVEPAVRRAVRRPRRQPRVEVGRLAGPRADRDGVLGLQLPRGARRTRGSISSQSCISPRMSCRSRARRRAVSAGAPKQKPVTSST